MKDLLDDMRRRGVLKTEPNVVNKSFGFRLGKLPRGFHGLKQGSLAEAAAASKATPVQMNEAQRSWFSRG